MGVMGAIDMPNPREFLTPDELVDEESVEDADIGDEPEEAPDPVEEDVSGIELGDPDEIAAMIRGDQGGEG